MTLRELEQRALADLHAWRQAHSDAPDSVLAEIAARQVPTSMLALLRMAADELVSDPAEPPTLVSLLTGALIAHLLRHLQEACQAGRER